MNIFYLDANPIVCAQYHCDKHVVKMILEYAQLLSTAHRILDGVQSVELVNNRKAKRWNLTGSREVLYKATHINHPSAIWTRTTDSNYNWLYSLFVALCDEYEYRYGKVHKTSSLKSVLKDSPTNIPKGFMSNIALAMPDDCKENDALFSYRKYYNNYKSGLFSWKNRSVPYWIKG